LLTLNRYPTYADWLRACGGWYFKRVRDAAFATRPHDLGDAAEGLFIPGRVYLPIVQVRDHLRVQIDRSACNV